MIELNTIHHVDFRNLIEDFPKQSLIITDPPYNIGYKYLEFKDKVSEYEYSCMFMPFKDRRCVLIHYAEEMIKYIIPSIGFPTKTVSWCYNSNLGRQHRMIAWFNCTPDFSKVKQPYKNPNDKRIKKLILNGSSGTDIYDWWHIDLVKNVSKEKTKYTNQIPEQVIYRIIKTTASDGDIIIDPFSGSGTTCAVAKKLGFDYLGMDVSAKAIDISELRMRF